jgi:hypothetical protein
MADGAVGADDDAGAHDSPRSNVCKAVNKASITQHRVRCDAGQRMNYTSHGYTQLAKALTDAGTRSIIANRQNHPGATRWHAAFQDLETTEYRMTHDANALVTDCCVLFNEQAHDDKTATVFDRSDHRLGVPSGPKNQYRLPLSGFHRQNSPS